MLDNVANRSLSELRHVLKPAGKLILIVGGGIGQLVRAVQGADQGLVVPWFVDQKMGMFIANHSRRTSQLAS